MRMYNSNPTEILYPNPGYGQPTLPAVYHPDMGSTYLLEPSMNGPLETVEATAQMIPGVGWLNDMMPDAIPGALKTVVSLALVGTAAMTLYGVVFKRESIKKAYKKSFLGGLMKNPKNRRNRRNRRNRKNRRNRRNYFPGATSNPRNRANRRNKRNRRNRRNRR